MSENLNNQVFCEECQEPRGEYQLGGTNDQILEDPIQFNYLSRDAATSTARFVAHLLCKCGTLAEVWSENSEAFVLCRECGEYRIIDLIGITDLVSSFLQSAFFRTVR